MYNHNSKSQEREHKGLEPRDVKSIEAVNYSLKIERKKNRDRISYFGPILARSCFGFLVPYLLLMPIVPMMFDVPGSEHNYLAWVVVFLVVIAPIVLITTGIVLRKLNRKWSAQQLGTPHVNQLKRR